MDAEYMDIDKIDELDWVLRGLESTLCRLGFRCWWDDDMLMGYLLKYGSEE